MYEILLERAAEKDLNRLPPEVFHRVISHIKKLADNQRPPGSRKITGSQNSWRIRIGDYRVIYDIDDKRKTVSVMFIRHRKDAYR